MMNTWIRDGEVVDLELDISEQASIAQVIELAREDQRREIILLVERQMLFMKQRISGFSNDAYGAWLTERFRTTISELRGLILVIEQEKYASETDPIAIGSTITDFPTSVDSPPPY